MPKEKGSKKKAQRATSNVFAMFEQQQIQEFKEAFNFLDQDRDGIISKKDLRATFDAVGKIVKDSVLDDMLSECEGDLNFTRLLQIFGDKMSGTDPEDVIEKAFGSFDLANEGKLPEEKLKRVMQSLGDRFTDDEWEDMMYDCPVDKDDAILYHDFVHLIKNGPKED